MLGSGKGAGPLMVQIKVSGTAMVRLATRVELVETRVCKPCSHRSGSTNGGSVGVRVRMVGLQKLGGGYSRASNRVLKFRCGSQINSMVYPNSASLGLRHSGSNLEYILQQKRIDIENPQNRYNFEYQMMLTLEYI